MADSRNFPLQAGERTAPERFLNRRELADLLGIHPCTLDDWRKEPGFPQEKWGPRTIRFQASLVIAWARARASEKH